MIFVGRETNQVSPPIAPNDHMKILSRPQLREGNLNRVHWVSEIRDQSLKEERYLNFMDRLPKDIITSSGLIHM